MSRGQGYPCCLSQLIKTRQSWTLAPVHATLVTIVPATLLRGRYEAFGNYDKTYRFPACLGKQSTTTKNCGILQSMPQTSRQRLSTAQSVLEVLPCLKDAIIRSLIDKGMDGIETSINLMKDYGLTKNDFDDLCSWKTLSLSQAGYADVPTKVKTAFTKAYNKTCTRTNIGAMKSTILDSSDEDPLLEDSAKRTTATSRTLRATIKKKPAAKKSTALCHCCSRPCLVCTLSLPTPLCP